MREEQRARLCPVGSPVVIAVPGGRWEGAALDEQSLAVGEKEDDVVGGCFMSPVALGRDSRLGERPGGLHDQMSQLPRGRNPSLVAAVSQTNGGAGNDR